MNSVNPLTLGFYTVPEAARLIEVGKAHRIYGWLKGYPNRQIGPLLSRDYQPVGEKQELSFLDLMEVRFVEHFRNYGVKMRALRRAADRLRDEFNTTHPFATDRVHLVADRADVFLVIMKESAIETGDRLLRSLTTDNYVMEEIIKQRLVPGVVFDRDSHMPKRWAPRGRRFPDIVVDPTISYGQPSGPSGVPTSVLYDAWEAENRDEDSVAYWFDVPGKEIRRAIEFEKLLRSDEEAVAA